MAHSLRLNVIAEGVDSAEQVAFLKSRGCLAVQGFYYSMAVPAESLSQLLDQVGALPNAGGQMEDMISQRLPKEADDAVRRPS
jgi:sensor c-di-GMP phosphodiesterase-like protein